MSVSAGCRDPVLTSSEKEKFLNEKFTLGNRHKWNHIKNVQRQSINGRSVRISLQGLYQCECGAKKYGEHQ